VPAFALVGLQWGDEGKGKIVDVLADEFDFCVRFNGGANAGHTVVVDGEKFIFHSLPTGVLHESVTGLIGNGVVLDPEQFLKEVEMLEAAGLELSGRLFVSPLAHLVLPYHRLLDGAFEDSSESPIGTTRRGIGPAYADKVLRCGLRVADLNDEPTMRRLLRRSLKEKAPTFRNYGLECGSEDEIFALLREYGRRIRPFVGDVSGILRKALEDGRRVLFEGAQGALLDIDFGTYPFVTSSSTGVWGIASGTGVNIRSFEKVYGVLKAYTTRVGEGPFPTEETGVLGETLRSAGDEFGATTARPRRCGWLDLVAAGYAVTLNGVDALILTKLDVLSGVKPLKVAVAYEVKGRRCEEFTPNIGELRGVKVVWEELEGWDEPIDAVRDFSALPKQAQEYVRFIERRLGVDVSIISVGSGRDALIRSE